MDIAGYRIESLLGRGGMSVVYIAEQVRLGRKVALKLLSSDLGFDTHFRERFVRESQMAATIDHPNIIPIYDAGESEAGLYIAMRYVPGPDLKTILKRDERLSVGRTIFMLEQVASALDAAHARGLIHRDVKPANVLIEEGTDHAFLTDFGVAKQTTAPGLTSVGAFLGTYDYAAPEQIERREVDKRADVYALGCLLYECLTGTPPYDRLSEIEMSNAHLTEPPPAPTQRRPELPSELDRVVAMAMAKRPDDRYPSAGALAQAARNAALGRRQETEPDQAKGVGATVVSGAMAAAGTASGGPGSPTAPTAGVPEVPPPAEPPQPSLPPKEPRAPRTVTLTRGRIAALVAALVAIVAAAVVAAVVLSGGGEKKATSTSTGTATTAATTPTAAVGIAGVVPNDIRQFCHPVTPSAGAAESASCSPPTGGTVFYPDSWTISLFPNSTALHNAYDALRRQNDIGQNFGACSGIEWGGEGPWAHGPGKPGGRRFCYFSGNVAVIVWTHEKLGQPTHVDTLGTASARGSDHSNLFSWFRFWHHRIGKCSAPDCEARLK